MTGPKLPGTPSAHTYRDAEDRRIVIDHPALQRRILDALAEGPRLKAGLQVDLHVPETVIARELQTLRLAGQVQRIGKRFQDRQWALASYRVVVPAKPAAVIVNEKTVLPKAKPSESKTSWWIGLTREAFQTRVRTGGQP